MGHPPTFSMVDRVYGCAVGNNKMHCIAQTVDSGGTISGDMMMKIFPYMIAASLAITLAGGASAQDMPQPVPPPADAGTADAPTGQVIKPLPGDIVHDKNGEEIGTVSSSNDQQIVVTTTRGKAAIPITSLFLGTKGLAINMTKEEVDAAVQSTH